MKDEKNKKNQDQLEYEQNLKRFQEHRSGHTLKSRRDFVAQGLLSGIGLSLAPSLMTLLKSQEALGAEGCTDLAGMDKKTPIILIDLSGGSNIAGSNVIVGDQMGQHSYLGSYRRLGLGDDLRPSQVGVNEDFGIKFHPQSGVLQGMLNNTTQTLRAKVDGGIFCASSDNDTGNNPHNPIYWLSKAGATGDLIATAGTRDGRSGGRSRIPTSSYDPTMAPVIIQRPQDCTGLVSLGRISEIFGSNASGEAKARKVLKTMEYMSEKRLQMFSQKSLPQQVKDVLSCGYDTTAFTSGAYSTSGVDPREDADVTSLFDMNNGNERKSGSIAKMVLDGYAGVGTIELGGYDYHGNPRTETDNRDRNVGNIIGKILSLAEKKQKDVMIYVFSDGAVSSNQSGNGKLAFTNDDDDRAATYMLLYRHNATSRADILRNGAGPTAKRQIGHYNSNTAIERNANLISNNVENLAKAVVANYLALHGEEGRLAEIVGNNPFGSNLEDYLIFKAG